ncbi:hypothetical protein NP233_g9153 [Leucocoprinus birnbaumii]|uniref:S-adenosyl-L-methionine-dependent methyltransferase n=1 Tax=Leucocoprinus birnbaumii TaxID=56174 RepID=A0AAD5VNE4_9AGAR|nr:hypothetical protein NP233_g9153 [Leucocoprinus birnbaumii]
MSQDDSPPYAYVGEDDSDFFRSVYGRKLNVLNTSYLLPADEDEVKRSELHHRLLQFVFRGHNYIGPVKEALQFGQQRRILDLGTGGGSWAIAMADEFPRVEVIGIDLAPIQPRFELCDLDQIPIPYPDNHFDFIHARSLHTGIRDYPRFLKEIARLLRPGGLLLLIEPSLHPVFANTAAPVAAPQPPVMVPALAPQPQASVSPRLGANPIMVQTAPVSTVPIPAAAGVGSSGSSPSILNLNRGEQRGWITFWETYRNCLRSQRIDVSVPERLPELLAATGQFEKIVVQDGNVPVGSWPKGVPPCVYSRTGLCLLTRVHFFCTVFCFRLL